MFIINVKFLEVSKWRSKIITVNEIKINGWVGDVRKKLNKQSEAGKKNMWEGVQQN